MFSPEILTEEVSPKVLMALVVAGAFIVAPHDGVNASDLVLLTPER